jgi:PIN domain nuclease of toxin-antitoxin system
VKILLDTHIWIWIFSGDPRLSKRARQQILDAEERYFSAASVWELAIKANKRQFVGDLELLLSESEKLGLLPLPISPAHALTVRDLPHHHSDPFDRLLVAQALFEPLILLTADKKVSRYSKQIRLV